MKMVFSPAEGLMNRLSYPSKFGLLGLLALVVFTILIMTLAGQLNTTIERSQNELVATSLARPLLKTVEYTQQHRGVSSMLLSGDTSVTARRSGLEAKVDETLRQLEQTLAADKRELPQWRAITNAWSTLKRGGLNMPRGENFAAHSALVEDLLRFQRTLSDAYTLSFDPEAETFYLMTSALNDLPAMLERVARLRGQGAGVLAQGEMDDQRRIALILLAEEISASMAGMQENLDKVIVLRPELAGDLQRALATLGSQYREVSQVVEQVTRHDDLHSTASSEFFAMGTAVIDIGYAQMYDLLLPTLDTLLGQRIAHAQKVLYLNISALIAVMTVIGYLSVGAYLSVMSSVRSLREGSERLASGDLTAQIKLTARDELRFVAGSFNDMAEAMRKLIGSIKDNADHVADSATNLVAASGQIHVASQRQSDAAGSMAAAVEEMTVGIEHIALNAGEADSLAKRSGELSRQGGEIVASVVAEISEIARSVESSARTVEELGERSGQVSAIVGVIGDIAAQTNLLALNAAIEAARAGEQGRGFAVVADEVRKLAERTANSTREITEMVDSIQQGTLGAVASMEEGVARVNEGVERARYAGEAMGGIRDAANQVLSTVAEISHALREQSTASAEIAKQVTMIARMAEENGEAVSSNHETANRLGELADTLLQNVSRFKA
ncbi:methyl-accepting chemotaxis protein [Pseudomonas saudiphocaensis]|uniref:methyl-accepting chemotaxis protein n=1 Tax=Pseudomonas saudiphocaensis TaxID=1499686 RepID=UPI000F785923|nr:methyl-accepting chemotaxis protein [Pseudomonas saudiphocaensis]RRV15006.1 methyl-accepting chemotaxis protein [Pseudomonas saudiphocaensis]